jgi:cytochrome c oxidase subunit 4
MMSEHEASSVHVASVKLLLGVWVALMIGTWLTVAASNVDLGWLNIWIGLGIATGKAVLVALYYMHLRWDRPFNAFVFLGAFFFLFLFIGIAMMDSAHYQQLIIPDFAVPVGG